MRTYLRQIEIAGLVLLMIGVLAALTWGATYGAWLCGIGLLLWAAVVVFKACHWKEYERDNRQNIKLMLLATIILIAQLIFKIWK